jgi:uncharacterized protein
MRAQRRRFADGRLHLQDGPIDLIIEAFGETSAVGEAYDAAWSRFATILEELCAELPLLRADPRVAQEPRGAVARRMAGAVAPFRLRRFLPPMAAVAGAVAEEVLQAMTAGRELARAYVNNGGDIAFHLGPGESFSIGMIDRPDRPSVVGRATVREADRVRGVATSGWGGRSFSLGAADAVTVLAGSAALADAAATLIANAVDIPGHPAIRRTPARDLDPQSDLGERRVTVAVGPLTADEIDRALAFGAAEAELWRDRGLIEAAALRVGEQTRLVGAPRADTSVASRLLLAMRKRRSMPSVELRSRVTLIEEIFHEGGPGAWSPYRHASILAVIEDPFAGRYVEDMIGFSYDLKQDGLR